jgi:hypothetical protein
MPPALGCPDDTVLRPRLIGRFKPGLSGAIAKATGCQRHVQAGGLVERGPGQQDQAKPGLTGRLVAGKPCVWVNAAKQIVQIGNRLQDGAHRLAKWRQRADQVKPGVQPEGFMLIATRFQPDTIGVGGKVAKKAECRAWNPSWFIITLQADALHSLNACDRSGFGQARFAPNPVARKLASCTAPWQIA